MLKKIRLVLPILLAVLLLVFGAFGTTAELDIFSPVFVYAYEVGDSVDDGRIISNDEYVCGCCHSHSHGNNFGGKFSCLFCKISMVFKNLFKKGENNPRHKYRITSNKPATCTQDGRTELKCAVCGKGNTAYAQKLQHNFVTVKGKQATCTEDGLTDGTKCSKCNTVLRKQNKITKLGHSFTKYVSDNNATCTKDGTKTAKCDRCNAKDVVTATGTMLKHNTVNHDAKVPTCNDKGWDAYVTCTRCDYSTYVEKPALGHKTLNHEAKAPTCTGIGWDAYVTCERCDYSTYVEKSALGHNKVNHAAKAPTCTAIGWDAYETCSRCDYTTYVEKAKLGHDLTNYPEKPATCTESGHNAYEVCSRCTYTTKKVSYSLGHNYSSDFTIDIAPTCTKAGEKSKHCSRCESRKDVTTVPKVAHDLGEWVVVTPATCSQNGTQKQNCKNCEYFKTSEIDKIPHTLTNYPAKAATCEEDGYTAYEACSKCTYTTYRKLSKLGHKYSTGITIDKPATCTSTGEQSKHCTRTDCTGRSEITVIPMKAHDFTTWTNTDDPNCTETGSRTRQCKTCPLVENEILPSQGHDYKWNITSNPTCTLTGSKEEKCTKCQDVRETEVIPALGGQHDFNDGATLQNIKLSPSAVNEVTADFKCSRCNTDLTGESVNAVAALQKKNNSVYSTAFGYHTLEGAIAASVDTNVYLLKDYTLTQDITVKNGVKLVIPCFTNDIGHIQRAEAGGDYLYYCPDNDNPQPDPLVLFRKLTVDENATITVGNGATFLVSAVTGYKNSWQYTYGVTGNYAAIDLAGTINVNDGGVFDCSGYVYDLGGQVNLNSGAKMFETYGVMKWRGASFGKASTDKRVFPIDEYEFNNMKATLNIVYGAEYYATVKMAADARVAGIGDGFKHFYCHMPMVGTDVNNFLYALQPGATLTKTVVNDRERYVFNGNVVLGCTELTVLTFNYSTITCDYYKFNGSRTMEFYNGNVETVQNYVFLPGFEIIVGSGATLKTSGYSKWILATANDYTVNGTTYESFYHYDNQYGNKNALYTPGRDDAKLIIRNGGKVNIESGSKIVGKVYVENGATFIHPSSSSSAKLTLKVAYGDVANPGMQATCNFNNYSLVLMKETYNP